jgi:hypothetical protein
VLNYLSKKATLPLPRLSSSIGRIIENISVHFDVVYRTVILPVLPMGVKLGLYRNMHIDV